MTPIARNLLAECRDGRVTILRPRAGGPDNVIELKYSDMEALLDFWHKVRPPPTVESLEEILRAE